MILSNNIFEASSIHLPASFPYVCKCIGVHDGKQVELVVVRSNTITTINTSTIGSNNNNNKLVVVTSLYPSLFVLKVTKTMAEIVRVHMSHHRVSIHAKRGSQALLVIVIAHVLLLLLLLLVLG